MDKKLSSFPDSRTPLTPRTTTPILQFHPEIHITRSRRRTERQLVHSLRSASAMDKTSDAPRLASHRPPKVLVLGQDKATLAHTTDILERAGFLALCQTSSSGAADFAIREKVAAAVIDFDALARSERIARALRAHVSLETLPIVLIAGALEQAESSLDATTLERSLVRLVLVPLVRSMIEHRVRNDAWERRC
ncbi:MAG: hypothetical protein QM778_28025 [Myxococcales bacterium]